MARYTASIETSLEAKDAFDYLADFANAAQWDPGVRSAERLTPGPIDAGTAYRLTVSFLGRAQTMTYRIKKWDPPNLVVLESDMPRFTSHDEIRVTPTKAGARVDYDANIRLKGALGVLDPVATLAFKRIGDKAVRGLKDELARRAGEIT